MSYVATWLTCGPPLILSPALERRGTPRRQGLCSRRAHLWATSDFVPRSKASGIPQAVGGYVAISDFVPCFGASGTPQAAWVM